MSKTKAYYFKFDATEYLAATSKVQMLNYEEKGLFIELCAMSICENGTIRNDELLHRKLRISKPKLTKTLEYFANLKLLLSTDGFLSVKFIREAISDMHEEHKKRIENGKKGGRPKTTQNLSSKNENKNQKKKENQKKNYKENIAFESPLSPPNGGIPEPSKFIPNEKKDSIEQVRDLQQVCGIPLH